MAILEIIKYPDKLLSLTSDKIETIDDSIRSLIEDMADTMYDAPGVGLAAVQVGVTKQIIVYDENGANETKDYQVIINPIIIEQDGSYFSEDEGCLSVPEYTSNVKRSSCIKVEGIDIKGEHVVIEAEGYLAIILQHEIDHLNGILFIDRISKLKKQIYKRKIIKKLKNND